MEIQEFIKQLDGYCEKNQTDILAYLGPINRLGYDRLCDVIPKQPKKNCLLVLCTYGGNPDAGYRIARALSHHYPNDGKLSILVPSYCKSAGTLICTGADSLIFCDRGELGPLDVQMRKQDELIEQSSTLDLLRGINNIQESVLDSFRRYLVDVNHGTRMSTKTASDIACKLAIGIFEPVFAQIDPQRVGEMNAAMQIAIEYAGRLNERYLNLKPEAINRLASGYPSHGFVIDRKEARDLFNRIKRPGKVCDIIGSQCAQAFLKIEGNGEPLVDDLVKHFKAQLQQPNSPEENNETNHTSVAQPASAAPASDADKSASASKPRHRRASARKPT